MKDDLGSVWGPEQRPPKKIEKKTKVKNPETMPTAIHIHGALQAGQQPQAKTSKIANNKDIAFPTRKVRKIKFGLAIRKSIGQTHA